MLKTTTFKKKYGAKYRIQNTSSHVGYIFFLKRGLCIILADGYTYPSKPRKKICRMHCQKKSYDLKKKSYATLLELITKVDGFMFCTR